MAAPRCLLSTMQDHFYTTTMLEKAKRSWHSCHNRLAKTTVGSTAVEVPVNRGLVLQRYLGSLSFDLVHGLC